jgi:hypothetical protein
MRLKSFVSKMLLRCLVKLGMSTYPIPTSFVQNAFLIFKLYATLGSLYLPKLKLQSATVFTLLFRLPNVDLINATKNLFGHKIVSMKVRF